jgi:hypothetical protein
MAYMSAHPTPAQRAPAASPGNEAAVVLRDVLEPTLPAQQMYARSRPPPPEPLTLDATMKLLIVLIVVLAVALAVVLVLLARR